METPPLVYRRKSPFFSWIPPFLLLSVFFSVAMDISRVLYTGSHFLFSLIWNLFLAAIPYLISVGLEHSPKLYKKNAIFYLVVMVWIIFFPNAPYILTDLFHLTSPNTFPKWYDLLLILSFAWNGMMLAILSLRQMERMITQKWNRAGALVFVGVMLLASAFGIYVGRYLRFNSWDIFTNPFQIGREMVQIIFHPLHFKGAWGMTASFTVWLGIVYFSIPSLVRALR
ncbi:MAG: DUF1361 domain-containing protein [Chitinophagaceae bacterium]